jgi:hypothetical protein
LVAQNSGWKSFVGFSGTSEISVAHGLIISRLLVWSVCG